MINFWDKQRVLITGGDGFIGCKVISKLKNKGCIITAPGSMEYDLREKSSAIELVKNKDIVIHLAAFVGGLEFNGKYPADIFYNNSVMSLNIINAACKANIKKFIGIGSIRSYSDLAQMPLKEKDIWFGSPKSNNAAYGLSKRFMMAQSQFFSEQYCLPIVHLILTNTYGPNVRLDSRITGITAMIKKVAEAKKNNEKTITFWGSGKATRDFLYIDDAVDSILFFAEKCDDTEIINVGSGKEISMKSVANILIDLCGYDGQVVWDESMSEGELRSVLDNLKATALGFSPLISFRDGVQATLEWYKNVK